MVVEVQVEPKQAVAAYFVAGHILSPATIYAHRPSPHIVTGDDICGNSCVFCGGKGKEETDRQTGQIWDNF